MVEGLDLLPSEQRQCCLHLFLSLPQLLLWHLSWAMARSLLQRAGNNCHVRLQTYDSCQDSHPRTPFSSTVPPFLAVTRSARMAEVAAQDPPQICRWGTVGSSRKPGHRASSRTASMLCPP